MKKDIYIPIPSGFHLAILESIPPVSYIKFETVYGEVAHLENFITVTYYVGLDIYEKNFSFQASQLEGSRPIPFLDVEGFVLD